MNKENMLMELFKKIFYYGVSAACFLSVLYLTLLSMQSTSRVAQRLPDVSTGEAGGELYNFFITDVPWIHLLLCGLAVVLFNFFFRVVEGNRAGIKKVIMGNPFLSFCWKYRSGLISILFFAVCAAFILFTGLEPVSDPGKILKIARGIGQGDVTPFEVGGYMHRYPDQTGIVLYFWLIHRMFGQRDFLIIQLLNAAYLAGAYYVMSRIAQNLWGDDVKGTGTLTQILCVLFLPMGFYVTFVYGMIPGFCFAVYAIHRMLLFWRSGKFSHAAISSLCIGLAIQFKTNSLIMLIAMAIFLIYLIIKGEKRIRTTIFLSMLVVFQFLLTWMTDTAMESITGISKSQGMPKTAWVAMGMQDSEFAPGVWNGYSVGLFEENNYDYEKTNMAAKEAIKDRLEEFLNDRSQGLEFFGRKNAMQWNEPSFQGMSVMAGREGNISAKPFVDQLCQGKSYDFLLTIMNYLQTFILVGSILFFFFRGKYDIMEMLLLVTLVGGLFFHLFWEAKPQYVLPYFMMLIPYCAAGYLGFAEKCRLLLKRALPQKQVTQIVAGFTVFAGILILLTLFADARIVSYTVAVRDEAAVQEEYEKIVEQANDR